MARSEEMAEVGTGSLYQRFVGPCLAVMTGQMPSS